MFGCAVLRNTFLLQSSNFTVILVWLPVTPERGTEYQPRLRAIVDSLLRYALPPIKASFSISLNLLLLFFENVDWIIFILSTWLSIGVLSTV